MSAHTPDELLPMYSREDITPQQAIGHILQNLVQMQKSLELMQKEMEAMQKELERLKKDAKRLKAFVGMEKNEE